ncbi:MAG: hypothetical protein O2819_04595 [Planctomycetota bacterium]|nr:hypothetical protein [Planctomycetota bacterium]MDA1105116.1 hypothetical protein [Planctomycetota bacterium]
MSGARVRSFEVLSQAKVALVDLRDRLGTGISEATSDLERFGQWLEGDLPRELASRLRKQEEEIVMAKSTLFRKELVVSAKDSKPSVVDEKKALQRAIQRAEDTRQRLAATKKWAIAFQRELQLFRGAVTGLQGAVDHDLPMAVAVTGRMLVALERYAAERAPDLQKVFADAERDAVPEGVESGSEERLPSMRRGSQEGQHDDASGEAAP